MNSSELRSTLALAGIFGLRMLGLFLLLPVFSLHARDLPGGQNALWVGLALGIFNIVQAFFHIPLGTLSDRIGRKPVVLWGLSLFIAGALIAASRDDLLWIAIGRGLMGAGAISAAVSAWVADLTRDQVRTAAMAIVGGSIGLSFALSLVIATPIYRAIGLDGMFLLLAGLGLIGFLVAWLLVPSSTQANTSSTATSTTNISSSRVDALECWCFCVECYASGDVPRSSKTTSRCRITIG